MIKNADISDGDLRTNSSVSFEQRKLIGGTWVNSLLDLETEVSGHAKEKVEQALEFMDTHVCAGVPVTDKSGEYFGIYRENQERTVGMVALFESDRSLHPHFGACFDRSEFSYNRIVRSVMIPDKQLSSRWRGIVLRHEFEHGRHDIGRKQSGDNDFWLEEQSVCLDDHEIIRDLYGDDYVKLLDSAAKDLSVSMKRDGLLPCAKLRQSAKQAVSETMEVPTSRIEEGIRISKVMFDLSFTALRHVGYDTPESRALVAKNLVDVYSEVPSL